MSASSGESVMNARSVEWREICRQAVARQRRVLKEYVGTAIAEPVAPTGAGGDVTLQIDSDFEGIIIDEIHRSFSSRDDVSLRIVTEELGTLVEGDASRADWVIIDPVDGSKNAAQGNPQFSLSVAVASGPAMSDVWFGYVFDFGTNEEFVADNGGHIEYNGLPLAERAVTPYRIVGCESAEPALMVPGLTEMSKNGVQEIRVIGSIAISLCYVALGRFDGLMTCKECRSVDAAAGQLIARQAGCDVYFNGQGPDHARLELSSLYRLVAGSGAVGSHLLDAQRAIPRVPR
jgi:myo-inositol-1(or 4)-monophosphatase